MYLIRIPEILDPGINLAIEEFAVRNLDINKDYLFIYQNKPSIIIGKNQNPFEEINLSFILKKKIEMLRRISGGGAVYHGPGNINFCYITRSTRENFNNYKNFLRPVVEYLNRLNVAAEINERNDLVINGKKISGNAQFTSRNKMLSHGTLLFSADLDILENSLTPGKNSVQSKSTKSVKSVVTNISDHLKDKISIVEFINNLTERLLAAKGFDGEIVFNSSEWAEINTLVAKKYNLWEWTWGRTPKFDISVTLGPLDKSKTVFTIKEGIIDSFYTEADQPQRGIFESLKGVKYWKKDIGFSLKNSWPELIDEKKKLIADGIFPF